MSPVASEADSPLSAWARWLSLYQDAAERAAGAIFSAWQELQTLTAQVDSAASEFLPAARVAGLLDLSQRLEQVGAHLVAQPQAIWAQRRPLQSTTAAIDQVDAAAESGIRDIPEHAPAGEVAAMVQSRLPLFARKHRPYAFRAGVHSGFARHQQLVLKVFCRFHSECAIAGIRLLTPWMVWRKAQEQAALGRPLSDAWVADRIARWRSECRTAGERTNELAAELREVLASGRGQIRSSVLRPPGKRGALRRYESRREEAQRRWTSEQRSVSAFLEGSVLGLQLGYEAIETTLRWIGDARIENQQLRAELQGGLTWVQTHAPLADEFPEPATRVSTPEAQADSWEASLQSLADRKLPEVAEQAAQTWRLPVPAFVRRSSPRNVFRESLARVKPSVTEAFRNVTAVNAEIVRDLETARDVLSFANESAKVVDPQSQEILREARANTIQLLEHRQRNAGVNFEALEAALLRALLQVFVQTQAAREQGQIGVFAHSTKAGWQRIALEITQAVSAGARATVKSIAVRCRNVQVGLYRRIGLLPPLLDIQEAALERPQLGTILKLRVGTRELPVIYRRLFRLEPVTDPRFLIGREQEMAALASAHSRWMSGQHVIAVIAGVRGSGKTSLLNCAETAVLHGAPVFRISLSDRLRSWDQAQAVLCSNLKLSGDLERELSDSRRIVILEEFERSYLRVVGGFDTARRLVELMVATASTTMWIVVVSRAALPIVRMALGTQDAVSLHLNAMALRLEDLKKAILQRHNLSGLRLQFMPPPAGDPRVTRLQRVFGLERKPSELFFESLYLESQGIFRAAFELWQDSVQQIDGGTLVMRQPFRPNYSRLHREMDLHDIFALHAVAQHGSLTAQELAEVFEAPVAESRRRLQRLLDLELLEPEPERPGFRLRPQAIRFGVEALKGRNLS